MRCVCRRELAVVAYRHVQSLPHTEGRTAKFGPEHEGRDLVRTLCSQTISTRLVHTGFQHIFKHPPVGQTIRTHLQRRYQEVVYQRIVCTSAQIMCISEILQPLRHSNDTSTCTALGQRPRKQQCSPAGTSAYHAVPWQGLTWTSDSRARVSCAL